MQDTFSIIFFTAFLTVFAFWVIWQYRLTRKYLEQEGPLLAVVVSSKNVLIGARGLWLPILIILASLYPVQYSAWLTIEAERHSDPFPHYFSLAIAFFLIFTARECRPLVSYYLLRTGILYGHRFIRWESIQSYHWTDDDIFLVVTTKDQKTIKLYADASQREIVQELLERYCGVPVTDDLEAC